MTGTVPKSAKRPQPKGGSRKGIPNKVTGDLRAMILGALDDVGGQDYLVRQAKKKNPLPFMALVGKCLPKDLNVTATVSLGDLIRQARERVKAK